MIPSSHKQRISITVDSQLLESIDRLTDNRSQVVEAALRLWYQQQIEEQLRQSYQQQTPQQQQFDGDWSQFAQTELEEINSEPQPNE